MTATAARFRGRPSAGPGGRWSRFAEPAAAAALALAALAIAAYAGVKGLAAVPDVLRGAAATIALLTLAGYAPARVLVPRELWPHFPLLVPLVGCAAAGLGLTAMGFLGVPFGISLPVLLGAGLVGGALVRARLGPARPAPQETAAAGGRRLSLGWPLYLAALIVAILVQPLLSHGYATVQGTNPDALLGVGTAELLQHAYPSSVQPELPVDEMPGVWRSKYPIYYALAGASSLSGLDPTQAFAAFSAVVGALTAIAFLLLTRYALKASPWAAVLAMALVGLDRAVSYLALHPYHNQLWGTLALAPIVLFGLRLLERPTRRDGALFGAFLLLGLAAYPLMVLYPALALAAGAVVAHRAGHIRLRRTRPRPDRPRSRRGAWVAAAVIAAPAGLVLAVGVIEKSTEAAGVLLSSGSLAPWRGDLRFFQPPGFFVGVTGPLGYVVAGSALVAAVLCVSRLPAVSRAAFAAMIAGGLAFGLYFRLREFGEYFYFKVIAFLTPIVLVAAAVWLVTRAARRGRLGRWALGAAVVLVALQLIGLRREVAVTGLQLDRPTLELGAAAKRLPRGASLRLDMRKDGRQLWAAYVLSDYPLTATRPLLGTTYPHPPVGRKADFIVADARLGPRRDADGPPLFSNAKFQIFRMRSGVPGPDRSSRRTADAFSADFR